jgi:hypothetical protein
MPTEDTSTSLSGLEVTKLLPELEVPFSPDQVRWRVTAWRALLRIEGYKRMELADNFCSWRADAACWPRRRLAVLLVPVLLLLLLGLLLLGVLLLRLGLRFLFRVAKSNASEKR